MITNHRNTDIEKKTQIEEGLLANEILSFEAGETEDIEKVKDINHKDHKD